MASIFCRRSWSRYISAISYAGLTPVNGGYQCNFFLSEVSVMALLSCFCRSLESIFCGGRRKCHGSYVLDRSTGRAVAEGDCKGDSVVIRSGSWGTAPVEFTPSLVVAYDRDPK